MNTKIIQLDELSNFPTDQYVMALQAVGKTQAEIGILLNLKRSGIQYYINQYTSDYGITTTAGQCSAALVFGHIDNYHLKQTFIHYHPHLRYM